jgi:hypothetical protein
MQTDARSISTILTDANGLDAFVLTSEMRHPAGDILTRERSMHAVSLPSHSHSCRSCHLEQSLIAHPLVGKFELGHI